MSTHIYRVEVCVQTALYVCVSGLLFLEFYAVTFIADSGMDPAVIELLKEIPEELVVPSNQLRLLNSIGQG